MASQAPERRSEYLFRFANEQRILYVSSSSDPLADYDTFRAFLGPAVASGAVLSPLQILDDGVDRYRDGGTTFVCTTAGTLYAPAPGRSETPTWSTDEDGPAELVPLDPAGFVITETVDGVTVMWDAAPITG